MNGRGCFLLILIYFFQPMASMLWSQTPVSDSKGGVHEVQYGDLKGDGREEKVVLDLTGGDDDGYGGYIRVFEGADLVFREKTRCLEFEQFKVERLRPGKKSQIVFVGHDNTTDGGPFIVVEYVNGKFCKTFDQVAFADFRDLGSDGEQEIVVTPRYDIPRIYKFDQTRGEFVRRDGDYRQIYENVIAENERWLVWNGPDRLKTKVGDGQCFELANIIKAYCILGDGAKMNQLQAVFYRTFGEKMLLETNCELKEQSK